MILARFLQFQLKYVVLSIMCNLITYGIYPSDPGSRPGNVNMMFYLHEN